MRSPTGTASPGHRERRRPAASDLARELVADRSDNGSAGVLLLDDRGRASSATAAAASLLERFTYPEQLPCTLRALHARAAITGPEHPVVIGLPIKPHGRVLLTAAPAGRQLMVIVEAEPQPTEHRRIGPLTRRERDVVELLLQGIPTKQIAALLNISPWTVRDHLRSTFAKTGVENRNELMALLLSPPKAAA